MKNHSDAGANAERDDLKRQRDIAWPQNVCPPCVEGDHTNCTGACDSSCCAVADLETELEMNEQALARANAVIERVVALHIPMESLVWESYATHRTVLPNGGTMATTGGVAARQVVRTFCRQCSKAFPCPTRAILKAETMTDSTKPTIRWEPFLNGYVGDVSGIRFYLNPVLSAKQWSITSETVAVTVLFELLGLKPTLQEAKDVCVEFAKWLEDNR